MQKENFTKRPPVVAVMGHIDHGKSTLLSYIRKSTKALNEAGGITQHISAYEVLHNNETITFLDTPGHEAFSGIRRRGANVADVALLVVSAEDGVKPQTLEALRSIKESKIPYIVAITKIDKPEASIDKAKQSLTENEIYVEGYGGTVPVVALSSKTGEGVNDLLDMILLVADMEDLTADNTKLGSGVIIESNRDVQKGISATCIIKEGSIKKGMFIASGKCIAPVRIMLDYSGKNIESASFSSPVQIIGWDALPQVGDSFIAFASKNEAIEYNQSYLDKQSQSTPDEKNKSEDTGATLPIIVKSDTGGTLEAVLQEIGKIKNEKISVKIIQSGIGTISENDVRMASGGANDTNKATIIGFTVKVDPQAKTLAERNGIEIVLFDVIYKLSEWLEKSMHDRAPMIDTLETTGTAKIVKIFSKVKDRQIIGGKVQTGLLKQGAQVKIIRRDAEIGQGKIREMQSQKIKTDEVEAGKDFGMMVEAKIEIAPGDMIESFIMTQR